MSFIRKFEYMTLIVLLAVSGILWMTSISFAQGNTWTTKTDMPTSRFFLSTSAVNENIYAFGGSVSSWPSWQACSTLEEYDPSSDLTSVRNPSWR